MWMSQSTHSVGESSAMRMVLSRLLPWLGRPTTWETPPETRSPNTASAPASIPRCPGIRAQIAELEVAGIGRPENRSSMERPEGLAGLELVEDRLRHRRAEGTTRLAVLRAVHRRGLHPDPLHLAAVLPEGTVHRQDLVFADVANRARLGRPPTGDGQHDVEIQMAAGRGEGEVLSGGPDRWAARRKLHPDDAGGESAPTEKEVAGGRQSGFDVKFPVKTLLIERAHAEELTGVHRRAP